LLAAGDAFNAPGLKIDLLEELIGEPNGNMDEYDVVPAAACPEKDPAPDSFKSTG